MGSTALSSLQFLILVLLFICGTFGRQFEELKTNEEVETLKSHVGGAVVYFAGTDAKPDEKLLSHLKSASNDLEAYNVKLGYVKCVKGTEISECLKGSSVFVFSKNDAQTMYIPSLYSNDAIVAHVLQFLLRFEIGFAQSDQDWELVLQYARNNIDVVLLFVKGLGDRTHRLFLEAAFVFGAEYKFIVTTEIGMTGVTGLHAGSKMGIWYYFCREAQPMDKKCKVRAFNGEPQNVLNVANFIQLSGLPMVVSMRPNGTSLYDTVPLKFSVHKVICFTETRVDGQHLAKRLKLVAEESQDAVRFIVGDRKNNSIETIQKYGISPRMSLPHCVLESGAFGETDEMHYEHLQSSGKPFVYQEIRSFVIPFVMEREDYLLGLAKGIVPYLKYSRKDELRPDPKINNVVTICTQTDRDCVYFKHLVMRLARTFQLNSVDIVIHYMDYTEREDEERTTSDNQDNESLVESVQLLPIGGELDEMELYRDSPDYESTLKFICQQFKIEGVIPIAPSGSDYMFSTLFEYPLDGPPLQEEDEEEGMEEEEENLFRQQEDEVARDMFLKQRTINDSNVQALDDKTFPTMWEKYEVLFINFYLPWDSRSLAFLEPFAKVAKVFDVEAPKRTDVGLYKVNCYNWPDVCQKANVTTYPEIAVFRKGYARRLFEGPLDEEHFLKAARLYQVEPITSLPFESDVSLFENAKHPMPAAKFAPVSVLGLFNSEDDKELEMFKETAFNMQGHAVFGFSTGKVASSRAEKYNAKLPSSVVIRHHSSGTFDVTPLSDATTLKGHLKVSSLPSFGRLTSSNLPQYRSLGHKLVILFVIDEDQEHTMYSHGIKDLANLRKWDGISFVYMPMTDVQGNSLKVEYLGDTPVPAVVYVDHEEGVVYKFDHQISHVMLVNWVKDCIAKKLEPIYTMKEMNWRPLNEGFDFVNKPSPRDEDERPALSSDQGIHGSRLGRKIPIAKEEPAEGSPHSRDEL